MNLAIIPARGGSKRIPGKNIKLFSGKPIIAWSIEAAKSSKCFERIVVSTDDSEIANIAVEFGAEVPFVRPAELSDDYANTGDVVAHAIGDERERGFDPAQVCCIYATAPFVCPEAIQRGQYLLEQEGCDFTFSVTSFAFPIQRAIRITAANRVEMFQPKKYSARSQDLEEAYHDAGQFYWGKTEAWLRGGSIFDTDSAPVLIPRSRAQDIDTPEDWERAELMFQAIKGEP